MLRHISHIEKWSTSSKSRTVPLFASSMVCKLFLVEWIVWASGGHESFGDDYGSFFVLVNGEEQHGLWLAFADVPAGRRAGVGRGGARWVPELPRRELARYMAEESARAAGRRPGWRDVANAA
jgi:MbtH-like protein